MTIPFCGYEGPNGSVWLIYIYSIIILFSTILCLHLLIKWITYMDYFPLKERSPLLCILLIFILMIAINIYPIQVVYYYFIVPETQGSVDIIPFKVIYNGVKYLAYFIYVLRSIRICFAYNVEESMRYSLVFKFFAKQIYLVIIIILLLFLKMIPPYNFPELYLTPIEIIPADANICLYYYIKKLFEEFPWQVILVISLWLQRKIKTQYGIIKQITAILILNLLLSVIEITIGIIQIYVLGGNRNFDQVIIDYACINNKIPPSQFIMMFHHFVMLVISIILPLYSIRYYHTLLPIQQGYDLDQNLKTFLLEPLCFRIFYNFLYVMEKKEASKNQKIYYTELMQFWSKITIFKLDDRENPQELIDFIRNLDEKIFTKKLLRTLNESFSQLSEDLLESDKQKVKTSINEIIDELQNNVIEQISIVYKNMFRRTCAYCKLKEMMNANDRINTNLLMLNMILREQVQI